MKTIIAATDFSDVSIGAINYAAEIAKAGQMKLILFHVYHNPVIVSEVPITMPTLPQIEQEGIKKLKAIERNLQSRFNNQLNIEHQCIVGLAVDEISEYVKSTPVELVVMGLSGGGFLAEKVIGSVTTSLISKCDCPVLVINKGVEFKGIENIVLASDLKIVKDNNTLKPLKDLAQIFSSFIYVLNVFKDKQLPEESQAVSGIRLDHMLEETQHDFYYSNNSDIVEAINEFVTKENIDLVAMIPRRHSLLEKIFSEPNTTRMAFHINIPLLTLPDIG
jgi:nucleotide-binding universal stress UspA family protein